MSRLIDADAMLKRLEAWNTHDKMDKALYNFARKRVLEQPVVNEWIPVSERLPEEGQLILEYYQFGDSWFYDVNHEYHGFDGKVIAWMPIPTYKENEQ